MQLPNLNGVRNASDNLKDISIVTPLELNERLSNEFNSRVFFKREDVKKVRSFKIRGAFNKIKSLNFLNSEARFLFSEVVCLGYFFSLQFLGFMLSVVFLLKVLFLPKESLK